jgi:hypothetical protein
MHITIDIACHYYDLPRLLEYKEAMVALRIAIDKLTDVDDLEKEHNIPIKDPKSTVIGKLTYKPGL